MLSYMVRRLIGLVAVLLGVMVVTYILVSLIPGDIAVYYAGPHASPQVLAETRHALGLDQPKIVQFVKYVGRTLQGDFGRSATLNDEPVLNAILDRLPASATLAVAIIVIEMVIALIFGTLAAMRERGAVDRAVVFLAALSVSLPAFWVGILLLYFVAYRLGWLPIGGYGDPRWQYLILPAVTQGVPWGFWYARILKVSLGQTLHQDYVRTARSKGLARWRIVVRHALPNAILPVMTIAAMDLGQLLGGIVVIETVFSWPGIGQLAYQALQNVDVPLVIGTVLFTALCITILNIIADFLRVIIDPRIRLQ
jgi:peptide/nickel transport system permease protein